MMGARQRKALPQAPHPIEWSQLSTLTLPPLKSRAFYKEFECIMSKDIIETGMEVPDNNSNKRV